MRARSTNIQAPNTRETPRFNIQGSAPRYSSTLKPQLNLHGTKTPSWEPTSRGGFSSLNNFTRQVTGRSLRKPLIFVSWCLGVSSQLRQVGPKIVKASDKRISNNALPGMWRDDRARGRWSPALQTAARFPERFPAPSRKTRRSTRAPSTRQRRGSRPR